MFPISFFIFIIFIGLTHCKKKCDITLDELLLNWFYTKEVIIGSLVLLKLFFLIVFRIASVSILNKYFYDFTSMFAFQEFNFHFFSTLE